MRKYKVLLVLAILFSISCAGTSTQDGYAQATVDYNNTTANFDKAASKIEALRSIEKVSDFQWNLFKSYEAEVIKTDKLVYGDLKAWESSGVKPITFAVNFDDLKEAHNKVISLSNEVSK